MAESSESSASDAEIALQLLSGVADVAFVLGLQGTVEWRRELRPGATGAEDDAVVGTRMLARTHPDEMATVMSAFSDLAEGRSDRIELNVRVRSARQDDTWSLSKVLGFRMPDGRVAGLSHIVDDYLDVQLIDPGAPGFSIADVTPIGIAMIGISDMVAYTNQAYRDATGLPGDSIPTDNEIGAAVLSAVNAARSRGKHHADVSSRGRDLVIRTHRIGERDRPEVVVTVQDVTELETLRAAQRTADRLFSTAFEHAPTGIALVGLDNRFMRVNPAFGEITGYTPDELLELGFPAITHPDDLKEDLNLVRQIIAGQIKSYRLEKRYLHRDGHTIWVELRVAGAYNDAGTLTHFISQIVDITSRKVYEEQQREVEAALIHRATHDLLTDLPNRAMLDEHLRLLIARVRRDSDTGAVLYCDLDGFKAINDSHGHRLGDRVLVVIASRLRAAVRETDLVARVGGDEFVVALASANHPDGISTATARIHAALCRTIEDPEAGRINIGASIGVATITSTDDPMSVIHRADSLAYEAKRAGGGVVDEL